MIDRLARQAILAAGRATTIPAGSAGLWAVRKVHVTMPGIFPNGEQCPPGDYTALTRYTNSTLYNGGETVMADNPHELRLHLAAAVAARGRVLVTGLGLACVLRMIQANPRVQHITVVERSTDVIKLVWPHTSHDRCELVEAEAGDYITRTRQRWDCAWHDVWTDTDEGEPHLAVKHQQLMIDAMKQVDFQGAWAFPRREKRAFNGLAKKLTRA